MFLHSLLVWLQVTICIQTILQDFSKKLCGDLVWIYSCFSIIVICLLVCKGKSKLALILSALILAVLFNMCFVYGCWYFECKICFGSDSLYYRTYCFEERHIEEFCANGND